MPVITWPEIFHFHNVRRVVTEYRALLGGRSVVRYRGKIKLHGNNAAVQIKKSSVRAQSRTAMLASGADHAGFAAWSASQEAAWLKANPWKQRDLIVYGEWCGPGIQLGTAVNDVAEKFFAVFSACYGNGEGGALDEMVIDPEDLESLVKGVERAYVIPWLDDNYRDIAWLSSPEDLEAEIASINASVAAVEAEDPWVLSTFGVRGIGEGVVYYPISHRGREHFTNLAFKAKGEKHKVMAHTAPVQLDPTVVATAAEFANLVLTEARLEQGVRAVSGGDLSFGLKYIGPFVQWIAADVIKETSAELEVSGLKPKVAARAVTDKARTWYLSKIR